MFEIDDFNCMMYDSSEQSARRDGGSAEVEGRAGGIRKSYGPFIYRRNVGRMMNGAASGMGRQLLSNTTEPFTPTQLQAPPILQEFGSQRRPDRIILFVDRLGGCDELASC